MNLREPLLCVAAAALLVGACAGRPAHAQEGAGRAIEAFDDVRILQSLEPLALTPAQLGRILPIVREARRHLEVVEKDNQDAVLNARRELEASRSRLLEGEPSTDAQRQHVLNLQNEAIRRIKQAESRAYEAIERVRGVLTPEQIARYENRMQQEHVSAIAAVAAGKGPAFKPSGDPIVPPGKLRKVERDVEQLRSARQDEFREAAQEFAQTYLRGLDPMSPAYRQQAEQLVGVAQTIRDLSPADYQSRRASLIQQLAAQEHIAAERESAIEDAERARRSGRPVAVKTHDTALTELLRNTLLHPRAPVVLQQRLEAAGR
jgi:hypothetical protein